MVNEGLYPLTTEFPRTHQGNEGSAVYTALSYHFRKEETNMKLFEQPELEVVKFSVQDVITESEDLPPMGGKFLMPCI